MLNHHRAPRASFVLLLAIVLAGFGARPIAAQQAPAGVPDGADLAIVTDHVDGDTFTIDLAGVAEVIRLAAIDAPDQGECFAIEAAAWLVETLPVGAAVYLERSGDDRDDDDRLLRYVWHQHEDGGNAQLLNSRLVRDGFAAFDDRYDTPEYFGRIEKLEARTREKGTGLWATCGDVHVDSDSDLLADRDDPPATEEAEDSIVVAEQEQPDEFTAEEFLYAGIVVDYLDTLSGSFDRFGRLMQNPQLGDDDWTFAVAVELATWKFVYDEAGRLKPPPAFVEVHALLLAGLAKFDEAADQLAYGLDYFDLDALNYALVLFEDGTVLLGQAADLFATIVDDRTGG